MEKDTLEQLRYPIGKFELPEEISENTIFVGVLLKYVASNIVI